ncbi:MAG TPA: Imm49 family immunity protein [Bryobacteraceae bacterium]|jgi:hypothetical protein
MNLESRIGPECYGTAFWMAGIYNPEFPFNQMGELASDVCRNLRTLAISILSVHGKVDGFYHNLIRSGRVRERYLTRCVGEGHLEDHHRSSGWYSAFIDTLAAGEFDLARKIADLSPGDFRPGHEYEDDYCYVQLIHGLIGAEKRPAQDLLGEFEAYVEDEANARLDVVRSLLEKSQANFDESFAGLLQDHQRQIDAEIEAGRFEDVHVNADRRIFIEGLAILRLAEKVGLQTQEEYLFCPSVARLPMLVPFPGE